MSGFSIHSSGRLYSYGDVFGFWRSDDAGQSWRYLMNDLTTGDYFVNGSAVSTKDADTVMFVTERNLYKSTDGGATWKVQLNRINQSRTRGANPIVFQPGSTTEMWLAATRNRETGYLWHSTDGGETWEKVAGNFFESIAATTIHVHPKFPDQIWVGAVGGLFVSTDHGKTFTNVWDNNGGARSPMGHRPTVTSIARRSDGIGYFASNIAGYQVTATDYNDPKTYKVISVVGRVHGNGPSAATVLADDSFVTTDNAGSYARRSKDGSPDTWVDLPMKLDPQNTPIYLVPKADAVAPPGRDMIVQDPTKPSRWFMTGGKSLVITEDSGATWNYPPRGSGMAGVMVDGKISFTRSNPDMAIIAGSDLPAFVVTDGGSSGTAQRSSNRTFPYLTSAHDIMSSDDGKILVAAGTNQGGNKPLIMRSTDSGETWAELDLTKSGLPWSSEGITRSAMTPGNPDDFLVMMAVNNPDGSPRVYRTTDGGVKFHAVGVGTLPNDMNTGNRYDPNRGFLLVDGQNPSTRYLAARSFNFFRSTDNGETWTAAKHPFNSAAWIQDLAVDRGIADKLWALGGWAGFKTSDDGGDSWTEVSGFKDAAYVDAANGQVAVFGKRGDDTYRKIYWSPDNGVTWSEATGEGHRYAFTKGISVDPWVKGKIWVSGISANVITGLPGSTLK